MFRLESPRVGKAAGLPTSPTIHFESSINFVPTFNIHDCVWGEEIQKYPSGLNGNFGSVDLVSHFVDPKNRTLANQRVRHPPKPDPVEAKAGAALRGSG